MRRRSWSPFILLTAVGVGCLAPASAAACDRSPDLARIPGSTDEEAEARYTSYERDRDIIAKVDLEKRAIESNWTVYLAKVEKVVPDNTEDDPSTVILTPVWPVRGVLPTKSASVKENERRFCDWPPGGLHGSKVGDLVVVFGEYGSTAAWRASEVRSGELIDAIDLYAWSLEKKSQ